MITPRSAASIRSSATRVPCTVPRNVTSTMWRNSSGSIRMNGLYIDTMALLIHRSMRPNARWAASAAACTSSKRLTSAATTRARPPRCSTSRLAPARPSRPRAISTTRAPRSPSSRAVARPTPPDAPVTTATVLWSTLMFAPPQSDTGATAGRHRCADGAAPTTARRWQSCPPPGCRPARWAYDRPRHIGFPARHPAARLDLP
jgi:hypothetical protein